MLQRKHIILGITGGIAAYKCAQLVRLLVKEGAEVRVVMTPAATDFVTPKTLSVLSRNEVLTDFFDSGNNWNNHVQLAEWADVLLIAPLTANTLAKMATGVCDNLLLAVYLSARTKTIVAPAMDLDMYQHPTVRHNLESLRSIGQGIIPAQTGELASGLFGEGRMAEPEQIVDFLKGFFEAQLPLRGKRALVTAGPTYEAIDPVRFIGNRSSGKMGIALAQRLAELGAEVTLVLGPVGVPVNEKRINVIRVESAEEMYNAALGNYDNRDIVICSAAVADYKPVRPSASKLKKQGTGSSNFALELTETKDVLLELGKRKQRQFLVGFALETENLLANAGQKLVKKNLDLIVANAANEPGSGIGSDANSVTLIDRDNKTTKFELKPKTEVAADIVNAIMARLDQQ